MNYRYNLDKSPRKFICPGCNKKRYVRYLDIATGQYLPIEFGRCDRESNCQYHLNPLTAGYKASEAIEQPEYIRADQTSAKALILHSREHIRCNIKEL